MTDYPIPVNIDGLKFYHHPDVFSTEAGDILSDLTIGYHSYGSLNADKSNVIWVCHALTANSRVDDWWAGLFGRGNILDPEKYFIVCANIIGSCYGTTGPRSGNPATGKPYGLEFPLITIRDWVKAHRLLAHSLGIRNIHMAIGGSCGGHQVLEMCLDTHLQIEKAVILASSARETAWSIAIHEAQRMAFRADPDFFNNDHSSGSKALKAARGMGLIGYRSFDQYLAQQSDEDFRIKDFRAASYIQYQGEKLSKRFYGHCYYHLLNSLDTHHVGRDRGGIESALRKIDSECLIISIDSDVLIPPSEQKLLAEYIPKSQYVSITSDYGHDGFLIESEKISRCILEFLV